MSVVERPPSVPAEGQNAAFDAGWNAHEVGLSRETVRVLAASRDWALLGYDCRAQIEASNPRKRPDTGAMLSTMRLARDQLDAWCEGFPHEVDDQDRAVLAELDSFVDSRTSELLEISGESTATDVLTGALREIAEADAKTPVLTLNRIAERALEAWSNEKKIA